MEELNKIRKDIDGLIKGKNFEESLELISQIWQNHPNDITEWDVWRYAISLKNLKRYDEALQLCKKYANIYPKNESINNVYAWCIFYLKIRKKDNPHIIDDAHLIQKLASKNKPYTAYIPTAYAILKQITNDPVFPAEEVLEWTNELDFDNLSEQTYSFKQKGKKIEIASQKEYFLMWHIKALFFSEQYADCIQFANSVFDKISKFHYDNDIWVQRLIAMSYHQLKNYEEAIEVYKNILSKKNEWFLHKEIAELYFEMNQFDLAFKDAIIAVENNIPLEKKVSAILLLARILYKQELQDLSLKHYLLVYLIRQHNNWKIDKKLLSLLNDNHLLDNNPELNYVHKTLSEYWQSQTVNTHEVLTGVIHNILGHGNAGFIKADDKSYYFKVSDFKSDAKYFNVKQKVSFNLKEGFDKKKQIKTMNAVNVKIQN